MRREDHRRLVVASFAATAVLAAAAGACGGSSSSAKANTTIHATVKDFALSLEQTSATSGTIKFDVMNQGPSEHEFVILKTDLPEDKLPVKNNQVEDDAQGVKSIAEVEDIGAGKSKSVTKKLEPGKYVLICNIPGHYSAGVHASFSVS